MLVKNNSSKIIGIQETSILPGDTGKVPEGYEKNPIVLKYIADGTFSIVEPAKAARKEKAKKDAAESPKQPDDTQGGGTGQDVENMQKG